jgi:hypothetical protein
MATIQSGSSNDLLSIDSSSKAARVTFYDTSGNPIYYKDNSENTEPLNGVLNLSKFNKNVLAFTCSDLGNVNINNTKTLFEDNFNGSNVNAVKWLQLATTMTSAQTSAGGLVINSGNSVSTSVSLQIRSIPNFKISADSVNYFSTILNLRHYNNTIAEFGISNSIHQSNAFTTGAYFQKTTNGIFQCVLMYNGIETTTGDNLSSILLNDATYIYKIFVIENKVLFRIYSIDELDIIYSKEIKLSQTAQKIFSDLSLYNFYRLINSSPAPSQAPRLTIYKSSFGIILDDVSYNKAQLSIVGGNSSNEHPFTGAVSSNITNSAAVGLATLSNTTAGYSTLGGFFRFNAVAGATTDYCLFSYAVSSGSNLLITDIILDAWVNGAAIATTPTLLNFILNANNLATSLSTLNTNRIPIGSISLPVGTAVGAKPNNPVVVNLTTPVLTAGNRFLNIILRMPIATATASSVIEGSVSINGYYT